MHLCGYSNNAQTSAADVGCVADRDTLPVEPNLDPANDSFNSHEAVEQPLAAHHLAAAESARTRGREYSQAVAQEALRCCFRLFETMHLIRPGAAWRPAFYAYVCVHVCALWFRVWVYLCELRPTGRVEETTVSSNQRGSSSQAVISEAVARNQPAARQ
jgi:hypothetical protein